MSCNISISNVSAQRKIGSSKDIESITVAGTAVGCDSLSIDVICSSYDGGAGSTFGVPVDAQGTFSATFPALFTALPCGCGDDVLVTVTCEQNHNCKAVEALTLTCEECECPTLTTLDIKECYHLSGDLTLEIEIDDPDNCIASYVWHFEKQPGPDVQKCGKPPTSAFDLYTNIPKLAVPINSYFDVGNWTVTIVASLASGSCCDHCAGPLISAAYHFAVGPTQPCPAIVSFNDTLVSSTPAGFEYQFDIQLSGYTENATLLPVVNGQPQQKEYPCGSTVISFNYTFPCSMHGTMVVLQLELDPGNRCCEPQHHSKLLSLPKQDCGVSPPPCPEIAIEATVEACSNGERETDIEAHLSIPNHPNDPLSAELAVDGTVVDAKTGTGQGVDLSESGGTYGCGSHTIQVVPTVPANCPPKTLTFCVPICESTLCGIVKVLVIGFLAGFFSLLPHVVCSAVAGQFSLMLPWAVYSLIGGLVFLIIWMTAGCVKKCSRCQWLLLMWQVLVATILVSLLLIACCTTVYMWFIIGYLILGIIIYAIWKKDCCSSNCFALKALAVAMTTAVGTTAVAVLFTPAGFCFNQILSLILGTVTTLVVVKALYCKDEITFST